MHDPLKARPVSGEIMARRVAGTESPFGVTPRVRHDIVEAEFETIRPEAGSCGFRGGSANVPEGIGVLTRNAKQARMHDERGGFAFWMTGAILVLAAFLAFGGYGLLNGERPGSSLERSQRLPASIPLRASGAEAQGDPVKPHFLGTSGHGLKSQGSFVFSEGLEVPKDRSKSVSISFVEE